MRYGHIVCTKELMSDRLFKKSLKKVFPDGYWEFETKEGFVKVCGNSLMMEEGLTPTQQYHYQLKIRMVKLLGCIPIRKMEIKNFSKA